MVLQWCATNPFDVAMNEFFRADDAKAAGFISHLFTMGASTIFALYLVLRPSTRSFQQVCIIVSSLLLSIGLNSLAKFGARRQRPCFHYHRQSQSEAWNSPGEQFVSFYSGDATIGAVTVTTALVLLAMQGYSVRGPVAAWGVAIALCGGLLRVVADMHWMTDALLGSFSGLVCGVALPMLVHRKRVVKDPNGYTSLQAQPET